MGRPELVSFISMPRDGPPFRVILTRDEVRKVLDNFTVATYRVFFGLIYATRLHIYEAIALETGDVDKADRRMSHRLLHHRGVHHYDLHLFQGPHRPGPEGEWFFERLLRFGATARIRGVAYYDWLLKALHAAKLAQPLPALEPARRRPIEG